MLFSEDAHVPARPTAGGPPVVAAKGSVRRHGARQQAEGQWAVHHDAGAPFEAVGEYLLLHSTVEHVEAVLDDVHAADGLALPDLVEGEVRYAYGADLALMDEAVQRVHGLVEGGIDVRPVDEQHVQVIGV